MERLLNEIEDNFRVMVPELRNMDLEQETELNLFMQPLRSENAQLRRSDQSAQYAHVYFV